jgi:hypothetical protein
MQAASHPQRLTGRIASAGAGEKDCVTSARGEKAALVGGGDPGDKRALWSDPETVPPRECRIPQRLPQGSGSPNSSTKNLNGSRACRPMRKSRRPSHLGRTPHRLPLGSPWLPRPLYSLRARGTAP